MKLTPERLDELERLEKAATKGPWKRGEEHESMASLGRDGVNGSGWIALGKFTGGFVTSQPHSVNCQFSVALRNAAPALIAAARREAKLREAMRECTMHDSRGDHKYTMTEIVEKLNAALTENPDA